MIYLYNPPKNPNAPINKWCRKMEQRDDCIHIHTDYRDVPPGWLGQDLIDSAEVMRQADEKQYRWVWLGQSIGVDEVIYYMFSDRHKAKPEKVITGLLVLVVTMGSRMPPPSRHLALTNMSTGLQVWMSISIPAGNRENKKPFRIRKGFHYVHGPTA